MSKQITLWCAAALLVACGGNSVNFSGRGGVKPGVPEKEEADSVVQPPEDRGQEYESAELKLNTDSQENRPPLVKIAIIVDDSNSMSEEQGLLSQGVQELVGGLRGFDVEFLVATTSDLTTLDIKYFTVDAAGLRTESATAPTTYPFLLGQYNLPRASKNEALRLNAALSDQEFTAVKTQIADKIRGVGVAGSATEKGLCTLLRTMTDRSDRAFFKQGDYAALLVISDEDDGSTVANCTLGTEQTYDMVTRTSEPVCTDAVCPSYRYFYSLNISRARLNYTCSENFSNDGVITTRDLSTFTTITTCLGNANCTAAASCSAAQSQYVNTHLDNRCVGTAKTCAVVRQTSSQGLQFATEVNACDTAFTYGGRSYINLYDYFQKAGYETIASSCRETISGYGLPVTTTTPGVTTTTVVPMIGASGRIADAIIAKADGLFGASGYFFSAISRDAQADASASCGTSTTFSYGIKFREIADRKGELGSIHSICSSTYAPALSMVNRFVSRVLSSMVYQVTLPEGGEITGVQIKRGSEVITLILGEDVVVIGPRLEFKKYLTVGDEILVQIKKPKIAE